MIAAIVAGVLILLAYGFGLYRGFVRGYYAALFDASMDEAQDDTLDEAGKFAALRQAGREGRN